MSSDNERTVIGKISTGKQNREEATVVRKPAHDPGGLSVVTKIPEVAPKVVSTSHLNEPKKLVKNQTETFHGNSSAKEHSPSGLKQPTQKKSPFLMIAGAIACLMIVWFALSRRGGVTNHQDVALAVSPNPSSVSELPAPPTDSQVEQNPLSSDKEIRRMTAAEFGSYFRRAIEENR